MERPFDLDSEIDCDLFRRTNKYKDNYQIQNEKTTNFYEGKNEVGNFGFFKFWWPSSFANLGKEKGQFGLS